MDTEGSYNVNLSHLVALQNLAVDLNTAIFPHVNALVRTEERSTLRCESHRCTVTAQCTGLLGLASPHVGSLASLVPTACRFHTKPVCFNDCRVSPQRADDFGLRCAVHCTTQ